jgi:thiol-disulfide isomerase/thioredoxin
MKKLSSMLLSLLVCMYGCKTIKPAVGINSTASQVLLVVTEAAPSEVNFSDQTTWLLGYFNPGQLTSEPHSTWYINGYDNYQVNTEAINKLNEFNKDGLSIKVVMGTWCPDSRREVPRFMRIMDVWKFPPEKLTFIGVDNAKLSPVGDYEILDIQRVPTFIIFKNNVEVGRIIENPVTSLEQDMVNILTGMNKNK